jgi:type IV secretory pathway VirB10-like protein
MEISKAAVGVLAGLCLAAGAGGAYIATRGGDAPDAMTAPESVSISPDPRQGLGVEQSEAVVDDVPVEPEQPARVAPAPPAPPVARRAPSTPQPDPRRETRVTRQPVVEEPPPAPVYEEPRVATPPALEPVRAPEPEPVRSAEPPAPQFEELVVSADSVVGLEVETALTSERARVEDQVEARVTRDVRVGDRVAIPEGARAVGEVTLVDRGGRMRNRARLGIRFTSIVLADGTRVPIETDTIYREGDAPGGESAAKIGGGAIGGAIIGGILGGAKGAIIGGTAGAGAGSAAVLAGGRNPATLPAGTPVTVRVLKPVTVEVEK